MKGIFIKTTGIDNHSQNCEYKYSVDHCPYCHKGIEPVVLNAYINRQITDIYIGTTSWVVFKCPRNDCGNVFIGVYTYYSDNNSHLYFGLNHVFPVTPEEKIFNDVIMKISPIFKEIYNQAYFAEQQNLDLIAGPGYRKALEFLIKDYSTKITDESKNEDILRKPLGDVINTFVDDPRIQSMAKRAAWLGNDETHYLRKWEGKDLKELKMLIELTIRWIEMVELSDGYMKDMPE